MATRLLRRSKFRLLIVGILTTFVLSFVGFAFLGDFSFTPLSSCKCEKIKGSSQDVNHIVTSFVGHGAHKMCILVPFRDRFEELMEFAPHMHKFLSKQGIKHRIVVINQIDGYRFNRASLINVGFLESRSECDYIAMHDVDLLPLNEELTYHFPQEGPYHIAAPHLHPLYHYPTFVGGILLLQSAHFEMLNGLSNKYWGWGREDDEFFVRMKKAKLKLTRPGNLTTGYKTFRHIHDTRKRRRDHDKFFDQRNKTRRLDKETGVATVQYALDSSNELIINGAPVKILNVFLECDVDFTPWCLQAEDHEWYKRRQEQKELQQQQQQQQQPPRDAV